MPCSVRQELTERMNLVSLLVAVGLPALVGPVLCPVVHLVLTFCHFCCHPCLGSRVPSAAASTTGHEEADEGSWWALVL